MSAEQTTDVVPPWRMTMLTGNDHDVIERDFTSVDEWEAWLRQEHPSILGEWSWLSDPWVKQYGTDYFWSTLHYSPAQNSSPALTEEADRG